MLHSCLFAWVLFALCRKIQSGTGQCPNLTQGYYAVLDRKRERRPTRVAEETARLSSLLWSWLCVAS